MSVAATTQALRKSHRWPLAALIVSALAIRVALVPLYARLPGGFYDEDFWKLWMQAIHERGVLNVFRATDSEYLGYQWILWLLASVYQFIGGSYTQTSPSLHALVKVPSIGFDLILIVVVYQATRILYSRCTMLPSRRSSWTPGNANRSGGGSTANVTSITCIDRPFSRATSSTATISPARMIATA